jgi:hypothetical protein
MKRRLVLLLALGLKIRANDTDTALVGALRWTGFYGQAPSLTSKAGYRP